VRNRWLQLLAGIVGMIAVSNLQYGWTLFVGPIHEKQGWDRTAIQFAFTLFVLTETWLVPFEAYLVDRFGPRLLVCAGGLLVGASWLLNAAADSLTVLYLGSIVGGTGAGIVYGTSIGSALKWFPDRRGLAAGLTAAAFGAGSALTVLPLRFTIQTAGYEAAFRWFGLLQGITVLLTALVLRAPTPKEVPAVPTQFQPPRGHCTPVRMLRSPVFWLLYLVVVLVATGGLMATAQLEPMSRDLNVADVPVTLLGLTMAALPFAMSLDRVLNGITRPFFGWLSDRIGREPTMVLVFSLEGLAILLWLRFAHIPILFVIFSGLTFFAWGALFSLFPALVGDLYGSRYVTTNSSLVYTAKGTASLLVPLGSYFHQATGSWWPIFSVAVAFDWIAALAVLFILWPLHRRWSKPLS
jgi:OFA family oxalate/formate antiporter-like MFS transporter